MDPRLRVELYLLQKKNHIVHNNHIVHIIWGSSDVVQNLLELSVCMVTYHITAYSRQAKAEANARKNKEQAKDREKNKLQISKKIFAFVFASTFSRCEWVLSLITVRCE